MKIFSNKTITNIVNNPKTQKFAKELTSTKALLPVILLEAGVITGRTYQAHKRGGWVESRERITEETTTAVIWFGIISWLNKLFNTVATKTKLFDKNGLPEIKVDAGKDAIRNPMQHALSKNPSIANKLVNLKFLKIITASLAGILLCGHVLPKVNQSITAAMLKKEQNNKPNETVSTENKVEITPKTTENKQTETTQKIKMADFIKQTSKKQDKVSFKGGFTEFLRQSAHMLENNNIAKLLTIDVGLFAGRAAHARNNDERTEILFRDLASSFFYIACAPLVSFVLASKLDKLGGKNTRLDPVSVDYFNKEVQKQFGAELKNGMSIDEFSAKVIGKTDVETVAEVIDKFNGETIDIKDFKKVVNKTVSDREKVINIIRKAQEIIELRPEGASRNLLVRSEALNALSDGLVNNPKMLSEIANIATDGVSQSSTKFISYKEIDKVKSSVSDYAKGIVEYARKMKVDKIDDKFLQLSKNRNMMSGLGYYAIGFGIATFFLSYAIPKLQYFITQRKTGTNEFPGVRDLKQA